MNIKDLWFAWYPADYATKTADLTIMEHGAYRLLLDHYYLSNGNVLANAKAIGRAIRAETRVEKTALKNILERYFTISGDKICHERADIELAKRAELRAKRAEHGSKGGLAKAKNLLEQNTKQNRRQSHLKAEPLRNVVLETHIPNPDLSLLVRAEESSNPTPEPSISKPLASKTVKGSRWPVGQAIDPDWVAAAAERRASRGLAPVDLEIEAEKFVNFWTAKSGANAVKVDWRATWINWALSSTGGLANGRSGTRQHGKTAFDVFADGYVEARAEREARESSRH
jgi:uncharacterized protein YdaU (DUF1376 family)